MAKKSIRCLIFFSGFMHAHVSYLTEDCPACLIMLTVEKDIFFELSDAKGKIIAVRSMQAIFLS